MRLGSSCRRSFASIVFNQYKFYVDFQGLLYFDDHHIHSNPKNLIRDLKFIQKFYRCLKPNQDHLKDAYELVGQFWGERNYLRYASAPIIFTALQNSQLQYSIGLSTHFSPEKVYLDENEKLCYPFQTQHTVLKGLFSNRLCAQMVTQLTQIDGHTILEVEGRKYPIAKRP